MDERTLAQALEAVLFASAEPLPHARLEALFAPDGVDAGGLDAGLAALRSALEGRGIELQEVAGGLQLRTRSRWAPWLARLEMPRPVRFSRAALETLSVVAYRQPITRAEVEEVRGVDCGGVVKTLLERGLVRIVGKKDVPGRPLLYGTARKFLETFGLASLSELPSLRELEELIDERGEGVADGPHEAEPEEEANDGG